MVVTAAIGTGAHGNHPTRLGHLVVDLAQRRRHLVAQRASDDHQIGLTRAGPEDDAELVQVVAGRARVHHLNRATGQTEGHGPHGAGLRPIKELVGAGCDEPLLENAVYSHIRL
ncbi:hypothetical protein D3C77_613110 [compost metagenome]